MHRSRRISLCVIVVVLLMTGVAWATSPRIPSAGEPLITHPDFAQRIVVKFQDEVKARAALGALSSLSGADLSRSEATAALHGIHFESLIQLPEQQLSALEARAETFSGRAQPDLAGMMIAVTSHSEPSTLLAAAEALQDLAEIEWVYLESLAVPPPYDIPPITPDIAMYQTYRFDDPGANSDFAWQLGIKGLDVRLSDCEYGWNPDHEDFNERDLHLEPGQTIHPSVFANNWDEHGTAVLGESSATEDGYGCSGMAPLAEVYTYPEWTVEESYRRVTCITNAIANSSAGDVVLLEMQTTGAGGGYGPAELDLGVWTVTQTGTDAGVVVVGAAGNGDQNLDSAAYVPYMNRGDSGAIIIGAGTANVSHNKLYFSTYGSRVNVHAWGESVFSTGYGDQPYGGGDPNQYYTDGFNGTSSASPIVASACCLIQSFYLQMHGTPLPPTALRQLLMDTGYPQGSGGHIGPAVNIRGALETDLVAAGELPLTQRDDLLRSFPNPFASSTTVQFELPRSSSVRLTIFDLEGRRVRQLVDSVQRAGGHRFDWNGRDEAGRRVTAGVYFYRLETDTYTTTRRVVLLK